MEQSLWEKRTHQRWEPPAPRQYIPGVWQSGALSAAVSVPVFLSSWLLEQFCIDLCS